MADLLHKLVPVDDGTLDYCASMLPLDMISAGHDFLDDVPLAKHIDWDNGMIAVGVYRAMVSAAPKPPESEIGPAAWVSRSQFDAHRDPLDPDHAGGDYLPVRMTMAGKFTQPLYPQARIDADAATIAALRSELAKLVLSTGEHITRASENAARAEAAEARVKKLEAALTPQLRHQGGVYRRV